jgi:hypothetical protein
MSPAGRKLGEENLRLSRHQGRIPAIESLILGRVLLTEHNRSFHQDLHQRVGRSKETEFIIARNGKPVARVVPIAPADTTRRIGIAKGEFVVPDNIDQHNEEVERLFVGETPTDAPAA